MPLHFLKRKETQEILKELNTQFGISKIPGALVRIGGERIFLYQGYLNENQIKELEQAVPIERIGVYFAKLQEGKIRLSIEGTHIFKNQIKKNIIEISKEDAEKWMHGSELLIKLDKRGFVIIKHKDDFLGTGKSSENKITNFIPKTRRLKFKG